MNLNFLLLLHQLFQMHFKNRKDFYHETYDFFYQGTITFIFNFVIVVTVFAQDTPTFLCPTNTFIQSQIDDSDAAGWLYFKNSSNVKEGDLFILHKAALGLGTNDTMMLTKTESNIDGYHHNEYQQYYKGLKVEGGEVFEHIKNYFVVIFNGKIIENLNLNVTPQLTEQQALSAAIAHLNASGYAWEDQQWEQSLKDGKEDLNATYYPKGQLLLTYLPGSNMATSDYRLTWRFEITTLEPTYNSAVYVNAQDGTIVKSFDLAKDNGPAIRRQ